MFFTFCAVFLLQSIAFVSLAAFLSPPEKFGREALAREVGPAFETLAAKVIAREGPDAPGRLLPSDVRRFLAVGPTAAGKDAAGAGAMARAPDGRTWQVRFMPPSHQEYTNPLVALSYMSIVITGMLFAAGMAAHLARPIRAIRDGFESFAAGDTRVRLEARMGRRSDEFADIARDFDQMADRGEELARSRERLIDDMAHELRSPLSRLQLAIAIARQKPDTQNTALDRIEREARRLEATADSLLTLSQLENGSASLDRYFDMRSLVEETVADARFEGQPKNIAITLTVDGDYGPVDVKGDAELMRRAIENVMRNALRFSPRGGRISVTLRLAHGGTELVFEDEGPGIAHEQVATLFEPFSRGAGEVGGYGLGLAIARRAVSAHGGTIGAENRKSHGMRVTMNIPTN